MVVYLSTFFRFSNYLFFAPSHKPKLRFTHYWGITKVINGKSPKQVQSHAQKYFLRQQQETKTKRSIHDFNFSDLLELLQDDKYRAKVRLSDSSLNKCKLVSTDIYIVSDKRV